MREEREPHQSPRSKQPPEKQRGNNNKQTSDDSLKHALVHRFSRSNRRRPAIVRGDRYQFGMFHIPQCCLVPFEWEVHQRVVVWNLWVSVGGGKGGETVREPAYFFFLGQSFHEAPGLGTCPREVLSILSVVTESALSHLPNTAGDDVFHSARNARTVANLIDQLASVRVNGLDSEGQS